MVKKADNALDSVDIANIDIAETEAKAVEKVIAKNPSVKKTADKKSGFCVYIGPNIRGVIQSGTVYGKSLEETKAFLAGAIEKYPLIGKLISTDKTIAEDRIKVKTAGNLLNVYYTKLASGKSI